MQLQEATNKLKEILGAQTHLVGQLIDSVQSIDHTKPGDPSPLPPGQQYTPPVSSYTPGPNPQPPYMGANAAYTPGGPRRKQVRATQACNNCRQRKQKCDELKPCSFCKDNNFECQYKEFPPTK